MGQASWRGQGGRGGARNHGGDLVGALGVPRWTDLAYTCLPEGARPCVQSQRGLDGPLPRGLMLTETVVLHLSRLQEAQEAPLPSPPYVRQRPPRRLKISPGAVGKGVATA